MLPSAVSNRFDDHYRLYVQISSSGNRVSAEAGGLACCSSASLCRIAYFGHWGVRFGGHSVPCGAFWPLRGVVRWSDCAVVRRMADGDGGGEARGVLCRPLLAVLRRGARFGRRGVSFGGRIVLWCAEWPMKIVAGGELVGNWRGIGGRLGFPLLLWRSLRAGLRVLTVEGCCLSVESCDCTKNGRWMHRGALGEGVTHSQAHGNGRGRSEVRAEGATHSHSLPRACTGRTGGCGRRPWGEGVPVAAICARGGVVPSWSTSFGRAR